MTIQIELESLRKEEDVASRESCGEARGGPQDSAGPGLGAQLRVGEGKADIDAVKKTQEELDAAKVELDQAQREEATGCARVGAALWHHPGPRGRMVPKEGEKSGPERVLIHDAVTADDIANVVSRITGIPVSKLTSGHIEKLVHMEDTLQESVRGQDDAIKVVSNAVRLQRAGLSGENRPLASFSPGPHGRRQDGALQEAGGLPLSRPSRPSCAST